jgi:hypothetical protein
MKKIPTYFDWKTARTCPECGSHDYERSVTYQRVVRRVDGRTMVWFVASDAGYFWCMKCEFKEFS